MSTHASNEYFRNAVLTAKPEQLQMMLYDGAIRFARQGREALLRKDFETACEKLIRVQKIISEMQNGLRPEINAELCDQLARLYNFIYQRLVDANVQRDVEPLEEALRILEHQRETWRLLLERIGTVSGDAPRQSDSPKSGNETLSIQG
ncbi:MAG: flagellar export chaperone FliS [Planctomycetota bacterium]